MEEKPSFQEKCKHQFTEYLAKQFNYMILIPAKKKKRRHRTCVKYAKMFIYVNNKLLAVRNPVSSVEAHIHDMILFDFQLAGFILVGVIAFIYLKFEWISLSNIRLVLFNHFKIEVECVCFVNFSATGLEMFNRCRRFGAVLKRGRDIQIVLHFETKSMSISLRKFITLLMVFIAFNDWMSLPVFNRVNCDCVDADRSWILCEC